jgi:LysM repeat protein
MNNQSPLVPQGSLAEQKNKGRARVKIAVFFVLAIHGIGLMALLVQGCQKEKETGQTQAGDQTNNAAAPAFAESSNAPAAPMTAEVPATPSNSMPAGPAAADTHGVSAPMPAPAATATEYTIAARDNFSTIAKKFGVTSKAIAEANPGVESTKLRVGQKIHVPAPAPAGTPSAVASTAATPTVEPANGEKLYTVQSGDSLIKIARNSGTQVKTIRTLNNLKSDNIRVGQKLKLPAAKSSTSTAALTPSENAPMVSSVAPLGH